MERPFDKLILGTLILRINKNQSAGDLSTCEPKRSRVKD